MNHRNSEFMTLNNGANEPVNLHHVLKNTSLNLNHGPNKDLKLNHLSNNLLSEYDLSG